jgi:hypothetical protein
VKIRFPLRLLAVAFLSAGVSSAIGQTDVGGPGGVPGYKPSVPYYGKGAFRPAKDPEPPDREVQMDDLGLPSPTPIVVPSPTPIVLPSPTPISTPIPTPTANPTPTAVPSASPSPTGSPSVPPGVTPTPAPSVPPPPPPPVVPPLPRPTISPVATAPPAQKATVSFADRSSVQSRAAAGKFQLVALHPSESVNIALRVSAASGAAMSVRVLDGGGVVGPSTVSVANGEASVGFQAGSQPGLYRVLVEGSGTKALFQFWVSSAADSAPRPPVLNPAH